MKEYIICPECKSWDVCVEKEDDRQFLLDGLRYFMGCRNCSNTSNYRKTVNEARSEWSNL